MGLILDKAAILAATDIKTEVVAVPEWGGDVRIRGLSGHERDAFEQSMFKGEGDKRVFDSENVRARLLVRAIVDDNDQRIFADDDDAVLGQRNGSVLARLYLVAQRLSGLGKEELEAATKN